MSDYQNTERFGQLFVGLYESALRVYGGLPDTVVAAQCGSVDSVDSAFSGVGRNQVGFLAEGERLQVLHGFASEVASYGARVAWGLGLRGHEVDLESSVGRSCAGGGSCEVRPVAVSGVSSASVGRRDAAFDAGAAAFGVGEVPVDCESSVGTCDGDRKSERGFVSEKTLANRAKRHRKVAARRERKVREAEAEVSVPEWRRKNVRATLHVGAFADCSDEVRKDLRDSRAKMLVEKNKVALVQAEHERRKLEARLKSRMVEEEVERKRLELVVENQRLQAAKAALQPAGYAETLCSMGLEAMVESPSLSAASVSPSSSISVVELREREAAMRALVARVTELQMQVAKQSAQKKKPVGKRDEFYREGDVCLREVDERELYSRWT